MKKESKIMILKIVKYLAQFLVTLVLAGEAYLMIVRPGDDIAGGVFMGLLAIVVFGIIAIIATRFEKSLLIK